MDERTQEFLSDGGFIGKGVFHKSQFPNYNSYANTDDLDKMQQDQYEKFTAQKSDPTYGSEQVFVLSWTMTLSIADAINLALDHITTRADIANGHLAQLTDSSITGAEPYRISPFLWSTQPPNIILIDNVKENKHLTTLALAFNRYYSGC